MVFDKRLLVQFREETCNAVPQGHKGNCQGPLARLKIPSNLLNCYFAGGRQTAKRGNDDDHMQRHACELLNITLSAPLDFVLVNLKYLLANMSQSRTLVLDRRGAGSVVFSFFRNWPWLTNPVFSFSVARKYAYAKFHRAW